MASGHPFAPVIRLTKRNSKKVYFWDTLVYTAEFKRWMRWGCFDIYSTKNVGNEGNFCQFRAKCQFPLLGSCIKWDPGEYFSRTQHVRFQELVTEHDWSAESLFSYFDYFRLLFSVANPTPRNALSVRWLVGSFVRHVFYAHLTRLLYFSNFANSISPKLLAVFLTNWHYQHLQ